jgi:hypothetical protein
MSVPSIPGMPSLGGRGRGVRGALAAAPTLPVSLIAFYELADVNDAHTNGYHLTNNGAVTFGTVDGRVCASFVGASSQSLSRADNADFSTGNVSWMGVLWYKCADFTGTPRLAGKWGGAGDREWNLFGNPTDSKIYLQYSDNNGTNAFNLAGPAPAFNAWHMVAFGYDATNDLMFVQADDGTEFTASQTVGLKDGTGLFRIGAYLNTAGNFFTGQLDQAGFWKRFLTDAEKTWLYNGGTPRTYAEVAAASP